MSPTFGSLFSGIGGFDLGLERAGWECKWQVEIDDWRRQVLVRHWPDVPRWGDVREFCRDGSQPLPAGGVAHAEAFGRGETESQQLSVDLICGGFPCQDLSVAGKRVGLAGERSGLFFEFARIAQTLRPTWVLIENVPGLLTASKGHDFAVVVDTLADIGYGLAWRILDSQYFGVPQRRRRVYIVGHLGAPCPPEILFEPEGGGGDTPAGGETGTDIAASIKGGSGGRGFPIEFEAGLAVVPTLRAGTNRTGGDRPPGTDVDTCETLQVIANAIEHTGTTYIAATLRGETCRGGGRTDGAGNLVAAPLEASDGHHGYSGPRGDGADNLVAGTIDARHGDGRYSEQWAYPSNNFLQCAPPDPDGVREVTGVPRWLDPCSRCPDGRRYAALGDAVTVNVIEWIGRRLIEEALR